jgi:hypothetical protein
LTGLELRERERLTGLELRERARVAWSGVELREKEREVAGGWRPGEVPMR